MTIQYCSDLHLEFPENRQFLKMYPLIPHGEILILAGDILPFALIDEHGDFFDWLADSFSTTYWLPGNHEYYHAELCVGAEMLNESIRSNVFLVNNVAREHDAVKFIFSTLWTKVSPAAAWHIQQNISDYQHIRCHGEKLSPMHTTTLHEKSILFLRDEAEQPTNCQRVVVTHHVPTFYNYPERFRNSIYNEAFGVELYDMIADSPIDYWIYGHHHSNVDDFRIGNTMLGTNQLGYVTQNEHSTFSTSKTIVI